MEIKLDVYKLDRSDTRLSSVFHDGVLLGTFREPADENENYSVRLPGIQFPIDGDTVRTYPMVEDMFVCIARKRVADRERERRALEARRTYAHPKTENKLLGALVCLYEAHATPPSDQRYQERKRQGLKLLRAFVDEIESGSLYGLGVESAARAFIEIVDFRE